MNLENIHTNYNTDKGTRHNYISTYEKLFKSIRIAELNILEVGILDGGSLKMWNDYFVNSNIFGMDNFSQHWIGSGFKNVEFKGRDYIINDLKTYSNRINLIEADSQQKQNLKFKFDIIIDDGDHDTNPIKNTFVNLIDNLKINGLYIIEDPHSLNDACNISEFILGNYTNVNLQILPFNIKETSDDILIVIKKTNYNPASL